MGGNGATMGQRGSWGVASIFTDGLGSLYVHQICLMCPFKMCDSLLCKVCFNKVFQNGRKPRVD
jgi:hypothetical protein